MSKRTRHNLDLPKIAKAIQEYKTTNKTQTQCAEEAGINVKLFSYYYLNGFKKSVKVGSDGTGEVPKDIPYQKKAKGRPNNYDEILIVNDTEQKPSHGPNHNLQVVNTQSQKGGSISIAPPLPPRQVQPVQQVQPNRAQDINNIVKNKIQAAKTVNAGGLTRVDLGSFL